MNVPNALTLARIAMVVPMVVLLLGEDHSAAAVGLFTAAAITDAVDGHIARSRDLITNFGRLMDPIADKLLIGGAFVCLAATGRVAVWVVAVILAREVVVTALRAVAARRGVVISANNLGKAKTFMQVLAVIALIVVGGDPAWVDVLVLATVAITLASGASYFAAATPRRPALAVPGRG